MRHNSIVLSILFILLSWLTFNVRVVFMVSSFPKLLVVSYDAFRYDYFNRNFTPFMNHLKTEGVDVDYMMNAFVTRTLPNHHTIATGFYIETHGVLENKMLYPNGTIIEIPEVFHYNKEILPFWTINEKSHVERHSGVMMWPGSEFKYNEIKPTYSTALNMSATWEARFDKILSWFLNPLKPINLGILYIEEPDFHGHALGTEHPHINEILKKLDNFTKYIYDKLEEKNLTDVNVIHLSDHGMTDTNLSRIINITEYRDDALYLPTANTIFIQPHLGKEDIIYNKLKSSADKSGKFEVFRKADIPSRYHYGNNTRMTPIFVVAKSGYAFQYLRDYLDYYKTFFNISITDKSLFGLHGYDNEDPQMRPMFFARGPAFKSHCKLEPFHNVDLFPLFCNILNLTCPQTNGTLNSFKKCLKSFHGDDSYQPMFGPIIILLTIIAIVCMLIALYIKLQRERDEVLYRKIIDEAITEQFWDEHQDFRNI